MIATRNSSNRNLIETIANELKQADKVLIGAGAGLSAADGFEYGGAWKLIQAFLNRPLTTR